MTEIASSPASSGPAGPHFEGQVGAYFLLSMLAGAEPRGLPGTTIDRIEFQRAAEGRPLDDVIVQAHDALGTPAVLEIQVKRSIAFTPSDPIFRTVVGQIIKASLRPDFWNSYYELAIAISRTSRKIDSAYQDVLTWARQLGDAATFTDRIARPGSANDDMRSFVQTFKSHMRDGGAPDDDETVWRLLRKLQILVFDFTATGSAFEELAKERAVRALHPDDTLQAGKLWSNLIELALHVAASGGDCTRDRLIEDLVRQSFRLAGDRRSSSSRAALAEAARAALTDIGDRVGDVMLTRHERLAAIHAALDGNRYVEIQGDAGVGKSGILKHLAEQIATEAQVVVLSPGRTIPKGWAAMRAVLGFDGTARDLMVDIAANGGGFLFVDNLDLFNDEECKTVIDLVREAASVPGFVVISTARRNFGFEAPSWLPLDALTKLGRAGPVVIGELSKAEVDEMRQAAPKLAPLLADSHPARYVTRNLYRLSRLATRYSDVSAPRTEIDMAEQWWQTADGNRDSTHRDRVRLLKALAVQAISGSEPLDVSKHPTMAVDALVASETLSDLGNDRVAFRHDVLREWAIGNLLHLEPAIIERLPLDRPASAALARGIELASRMAIERSADSIRWQSLVDLLSRDGAHGSWRRAALLALVRSEIGPELLKRASDFLFADKARVLRELIRIVMAVDTEPASKSMAAAGIDPTIIPANLNVPSSPSWYRLISWLLSLGQLLPVAVIPDVVDLYTAWSCGTLGLDPMTPLLLQQLYQWLCEIETSREAESFQDLREPFGGEIDDDRLRSLENDLRNGFLLLCNRTPTLAAEYLRSLNQRKRNENAVHRIMEFRGALAQAAPAELVELTATFLIRKRRSDEESERSLFRINEPFDHVDYVFLPPSPAQGPFLDLLSHSPQHGLSLIHRLVDHTISFYSRKCEDEGEAIIISFPDGERVFPWIRSFAWSREMTAAPNCVTSALMALEGWAHRRIDAGENIDNVLADVLGPPGTPAAYLLVAVDILLSHWPKSREVAVPFLASPELLCIDRERHVHDNLEVPDIFGLKTLQKEPVGAVSLESLKKRPSRRHMLDELLSQYAVYGPVELREALAALIKRASARLGQPNEKSDLGDPSFMAVHALNLVDPNNWQETTATLIDGTQRVGHQYIPPEPERRHIAALQEAKKEKLTNNNIQAAIGLVLEDKSPSSPEFAATAVEWAMRAAKMPKDGTDEDWMREQAVITAAMIAMRDGDPDLRVRHEAWAREVFTQALQTKEDPAHRIRSGLRYNPIAIAFVGIVHLLMCRPNSEDTRSLLETAASINPAAAHGFGAAIKVIASIDERLPRALIRCAFTASIKSNRDWGLTEKEVAARSKRYQKRAQAAVNAELAWLEKDGPEPDWPAFLPETVRRRRGIRVFASQEQQESPTSLHSRSIDYTDHQAAALWLRGVGSIFNVDECPWLCVIARTYSPWTIAANGGGLEIHVDIDHPPREWNDAYFDLLARCLPGLTLTEIDELALEPICSLPDTPFFDGMSRFLRTADSMYFDRGMHETIAVGVRSALTQRLMTSCRWKRLNGSRSDLVEMHSGPAIATLFFNDHGFGQSPKCYLLPLGIDRLSPFLPILKKLVEGAPSIFVAVLTLNLVEVAPRASHLSFVISAAMAWLRSYPDDTFFWIDHDIGHRVCVWIEGVWRGEPTLLDPKQEIRSDVDRLLAALVSLGVADAKRLEEALSKN